MIVASLLIVAQLQASVQSDARRGYDTPVAVTRPSAMPLPIDTPVVQRPRAVEYSDAYYTRLTIHRIGSYTMIPLFVAEYSLGQNLINDAAPPAWIKPTHVVVAGGIGVLFTVNTVTGLVNLWEGWQDPAGRTRRTVHSLLMLASDAGFLAAASLAPERDEGFSEADSYRHRANVHRGVAIGSFALSTVGGAMMWFWK
jgi:hypothetical protein